MFFIVSIPNQPTVSLMDVASNLDTLMSISSNTKTSSDLKVLNSKAFTSINTSARSKVFHQDVNTKTITSSVGMTSSELPTGTTDSFSKIESVGTTGLGNTTNATFDEEAISTDIARAFTASSGYRMSGISFDFNKNITKNGISRISNLILTCVSL